MQHDTGGARTSATRSATTGSTMSSTGSSSGATAQRWLVVLLFLGTALNYVDRQVLALLKPTLTQEFGWNDQQFAHLGAVFQLTAAAALLLVGPLVDRLGVRRAYGGAVGIWSLAGAAIRAKSLDSQSAGIAAQTALREGANDDGYAEENLWTGIGRARSGCGAAIVGDPDQVLAKLRAYQAEGIEAFILSGYPHARECDLFSRYVLPRIEHAALQFS